MRSSNFVLVFAPVAILVLLQPAFEGSTLPPIFKGSVIGLYIGLSVIGLLKAVEDILS
ncbi:hypothetical protein N9W89_04435 [Hellea sp.]|nr:hypothetical protein [Hellea sp.]